MKKFCLLCLLLFLTLISLPQSAAAQIKFSALTTLGYTGLDRESKINGMFRGDDPFNPVRVTLFMEDWINPRLGVFIEFLWDQGASHSGSDTKPRINGAYAVARPFDTDAFLLKIGMIPSSFGTWAPRTYADRNPLVGLPLAYHYRTPLKSSQVPLDVDELRTWRTNRGLPLAYDSCWDHGVEAFGFISWFEYSLALTKSSISSPAAYNNGGFQVLTRLGVKPLTGLRLGVSLERGSYLDKGATGLPAGKKEEDAYQEAINFDFGYSYGHTQIYSELAKIWWESPNLEDDLTSTSWYVELKQVLFPGFYAAVRYNRFTYNSLTGSDGVSFDWGDNVTRVESGLGYTFTKGVLLKLDWQHNRIDTRPNVDLLCTQLVLTF
ncbi:MAG: hypothetical protein A3F83_04865 [Candidatus Glassbacteria bacterium RIFCSPLOWO2_12_FULL_58_11]|uniref:Porin domain-containing protein n=1 Tax=Candidatus Glassbacteria bacterium RIFCSPLOWO2_12_FULL_58_11 TaxID=1817867 RepID=A0A1F5Z0J1_9BACT|nr:MAG: hypothetical protein A3F83_04865 [Candidatus Glassbacteria bacterium RIFCSPLOWO2_12_FULL_58_11]